MTQAAIVRGTIVSFAASTYLAQVMLHPSLAEVEMIVGEWVPKGSLAADDEVAVLLFDASNNENGVILGPFGAASALLQITGTPTNGQVPIGSTASGALALATLTGTANQITITNGAGSITISIPSNPSLTGYIETSEAAAPATPASGFLRWFADSTQSWGYFLNDAGAVVPAGLAKILYGPADFILTVATTALVATNNRVIVFAVTGTANQAEQSFPLPPGWAGRTLTVKLWWSSSNTNTGNVEWIVALRLVQHGAALPVAATVVSTFVSAGPGVANQVVKVTSTLSLAGFSEGDAAGLRITRLDTAANDTHTGSAQLSAVEFSVVG